MFCLPHPWYSPQISGPLHLSCMVEFGSRAHPGPAQAGPGGFGSGPVFWLYPGCLPRPFSIRLFSLRIPEEGIPTGKRHHWHCLTEEMADPGYFSGRLKGIAEGCPVEPCRSLKDKHNNDQSRVYVNVFIWFAIGF